MRQLIIEGGVPLNGSVRVGGAKNASYKIMIASLLTEGESRILNFSHIADVELTKQIIIDLGGRVRSAGERTLFIDTKKLNQFKIPQKYGRLSRASTIFIGPLLARFGQAIVPLPGGDKIGSRPLDRHFEGLKALGAKIKALNGQIHVTCQELTGTRYRFAKNTHTGTETLIMAAVKAQGTTVLDNAAQEPEVDDLIKFLNRMGGRIKRIKDRTIVIEGVKKLRPVVHQIMPDRNEALTYACAALGTKGDIIVENAQEKHLSAFLDKLKASGGKYQVGNYGIRFYYQQPLKATKVTTQPHPGFMTDWQPLWGALMTQAKGQSIIHEAVHSNRFQYTEDLKKMGAKITLFNPPIKNPKRFYHFHYQKEETAFHAAKITGPTPLRGGEFKVKDLRAGATLVLAALMAQGKTVLTGVEHIERGYENLAGRLRQLGAKIETKS
jgi:UDP-N-acetylglucosamine 1-carboxyvinyltransferase